MPIAFSPRVFLSTQKCTLPSQCTFTASKLEVPYGPEYPANTQPQRGYELLEYLCIYGVEGSSYDTEDGVLKRPGRVSWRITVEVLAMSDHHDRDPTPAFAE